MSEEELLKLCSEMRDEFQIPPYHTDAELKNYAKEGEATLGTLNPGCDINTDLRYRMLLKNYMYYAFYHRANEYMENYASLILSWQMETEVKA